MIPKTSEETMIAIQLPAMSSTDLNSTPRNTSSSKTDDFIAIAAAGIMKDKGFSPSK